MIKQAANNGCIERVDQRPINFVYLMYVSRLSTTFGSKISGAIEARSDGALHATVKPESQTPRTLRQNGGQADRLGLARGVAMY